jgi:hypothetical protein
MAWAFRVSRLEEVSVLLVQVHDADPKLYLPDRILLEDKPIWSHFRHRYRV